MYALRERRVHVTQEDFEMSVAKVTGLLDVVLIITYHLYQPKSCDIVVHAEEGRSCLTPAVLLT